MSQACDLVNMRGDRLCDDRRHRSYPSLLNRVPPCSPGVKTGYVHLCRITHGTYMARSSQLWDG